MAKINNTILEYKECLASSGITPGSRPPKAVLRRFVRLFKNVEDSRMDSMIDYPLVEVLLITFLAVLPNASTWAEIASFGETKKRWLKKFIPLKNGIPSHDTFRRVFSLMDSDSLQKATVSFLMENMAAIRRSLGLPLDGYRLICVDGKEQRGTGVNMARMRSYAISRLCMFMMRPTLSASTPARLTPKPMKSRSPRKHCADSA